MKKTAYIFILIFIMFGCNSSEKQKNGAKNAGSGIFEYDIPEDDGGDAENSIAVLCKIPWGITEDGFDAISDDFIKKNMRNDGFVYLSGVKLKSDGIVGMFDDENHLNGIKLEFSDFVIGEARDYSDEERRRIKKIILRYNENIRSLISSLKNVYGECRKYNFDDEDTDFYFINGEGTLAEWKSDEDETLLMSSNKSDGTGCRMVLMLERRKAH